MNPVILQEEQLSTRDLILKIIKRIKRMMVYWRFVVVCTLLGGMIAFSMDLINKKEDKFGARLVFNLELGGGGAGASQLAGLSSAFGFGAATPQYGDLFTGSNFTELITSRVVFEKALLKEIELGGKKELFINYYKDSSDISRTVWGGGLFDEPNEENIKFRFTPKKPDQLIPKENTILGDIYDKLKAETQVSPITGTTLTELTVISNNEMLSKRWAEVLIQTFEEFYKEVKTKKTREILAFQEDRLVRLQSQMNSTDRKLATILSQSQNVVDPSGTMVQEQTRRSNSFYSQQYLAQLSVVDNLRNTLINQTPILTIVEPIRLPLVSSRSLIGTTMPIGGVIGFFLSFLIIAIYSIVKDVMASL